jgi:hypothetical protein
MNMKLVVNGLYIRPVLSYRFMRQRDAVPSMVSCLARIGWIDIRFTNVFLIQNIETLKSV